MQAKRNLTQPSGGNDRKKSMVGYMRGRLISKPDGHRNLRQIERQNLGLINKVANHSAGIKVRETEITGKRTCEGQKMTGYWGVDEASCPSLWCNKHSLMRMVNKFAWNGVELFG